MLATGELQVSIWQETLTGDELSEKGLNSGHPWSQNTYSRNMLRNPCTLYQHLEMKKKKKTRDFISRFMWKQLMLRCCATCWIELTYTSDMCRVCYKNFGVTIMNLKVIMSKNLNYQLSFFTVKFQKCNNIINHQ